MRVRPIACLLAGLTACVAPQAASAGGVLIRRDAAKYQLSVLIDDSLALVYHYDPAHFLPYFHPVLSPSGKELIVRLTNPYPHHRAVWFADKVQLEGQRVTDFYNAHYKYKDGKGEHIRHDAFLDTQMAGNVLRTGMLLVWELDAETPVLQERRELAVVPLGDGEYLVDIRFTVTAAYGDVHFVSDATHYAWPYLRMHPQFSVDKGGKLVNSDGGVNQQGTHNKIARWCDYSNSVDGATEGLAILSHPENEQPHRWLTRNYGTFGPRRVDARSGKRFTLAKGQSLARRVGILVHKGDVEGGKVAERYEQYAKGELSQLPANPK
jgi:hypothetical protein